MNPDERKLCLAYSLTRQHAKRVERARGIVRDAFERDASWYVSLSGGKDSTCVLALARKTQPGTPAVFSDDEWWLPETKEYMDRIRADGVDVRWIRTNAWHAEWFAVSGDYDGIPDYAAQSVLGGCFLGLRSDESAARRIHIRTMGTLFFSKKNSVWQCYPIAAWSVMDVWGFILSNGLDYNRAYDRMSEIGVPLERQRIGPLAVDKVLGYGQLAILKRGWPDLFNEFAARHPEARNYV